MFVTVSPSQPTRILSAGSTPEASLAAAIADHGDAESYDTVPAARDLGERIGRKGVPEAGSGYWSRYTINDAPILTWWNFEPFTAHLFKSRASDGAFLSFIGTYSGSTLAETAAKAGRDYDLARGTELVAVLSPRELGDPCTTFERMFHGDASEDLELVYRLRSAHARVPVEPVAV